MKLTIKRFLLFAVTFFLIGGISVNAFATPIESAKNNFFVNDLIEDNLNVESDVYAVGSLINFSGNVEGDIIAVGETIDINTEKIGGSLRAIGSTINIDSEINRNITTIAENINIKENSKVQGVYIIGANIVFNGQAEDVYINADKVELNGIISGNVNITCDKLVIGENAKIDGDIKVTSENEAVILGDFDSSRIDFTKIEVVEDYNFTGMSIFNLITSLITAIILAVLITLLCKNYLSSSYDRLVKRGWLPFLIGFSALIIIPIAAIMLCFTVVCIPVSIISIIIYIILIYLAPVIGGILLGRIVLKNINVYLSAIIFTVIIKLLTIIPYVGGITYFVCILLSLGLFIQNIFSLMTEKQ